MSPFDPIPDWYAKTWLTPRRPRPARRRIAPVLAGIICVVLALASVTVLQPGPSASTTIEMIG